MSNQTTYPTQSTDWLAQLNADLYDPRVATTIVPARAAADATESIIFRVPVGAQGATVTRISFFASAAITGAATNYQTLSARQVHNGTAAAITGATTYATTASLAAYTEKALFSGSLALKAGDAITLKDAATGSGAALPEGTAVVEYVLANPIN